MSSKLHPSKALFETTRPRSLIPCCDHYAGNERFIRKALALQNELGPMFDLTCDCEDGAPAGDERGHAEMIAAMLTSSDNTLQRSGVRIHDISTPFWKDDLDIILPAAGSVLSHITLPKATGVEDVSTVINYVRSSCERLNLAREIPFNVLIETHGALHDVWKIAALPTMQVLDFGLLDFISEHDGAIPASCMRSPGQFEHRLIARAKTEIVAAALANGLVPSHNITLTLDDSDLVSADALRASRDFGFLRMWSIHPAQIRPIVEAMKPDYAEVERAGAIVSLGHKAAWAPIRHDDELHDRASYRYYWSLLCRAKVSGMELPEQIEQMFF